MATYENLRIEVKDFIATITLDRPPANALSMSMYRDIEMVFTEAGERPDVRVAVFTGEGKYFCGGRDIKVADNDPQTKRNAQVRAAFHALRGCAVPVIGAINGPALGGGYTAVIDCDIIFASERATFGLPEINSGLCGGMTSTRRHLSEGNGRLMYFSGEAIDAVTAEKWGLVQKVVPHDQLMPEALKLAAKIAAKSPSALRSAKWSANETEFVPDYEQAYRAIESPTTLALQKTEDHREATLALREKRPPVFKER